MPAIAPLSVQVFGRRDSRDTQKALRFFRERRVDVHFVDVTVRPPALGELRRFAERLGVRALLDAEGRRYRDLGLGYIRFGDEELFERLLADPALLRLPLVRLGNAFTAGPGETAWREWIRTAGAGSSRAPGRAPASRA
jgi:arsenate reductase-like glutaredoxin family protein